MCVDCSRLEGLLRAKAPPLAFGPQRIQASVQAFRDAAAAAGASLAEMADDLLHHWVEWNEGIAKLERDQLALAHERKIFETERASFAEHSAQTADIIRLNVGGRDFVTTRNTLCRVPGSMLEVLFSGRFACLSDSKGRVFLDRNGTHFESVLSYLRQPVLSGMLDRLTSHPIALKELRAEFDYFGIPLQGDGTSWGSADDDAAGRLLNLAGGCLEKAYLASTLKGHSTTLHDLCATGPHSFVSCSGDGVLKVWDVSTGAVGACRRSIAAHRDAVWSVASDGGRRLVTAGGASESLVRIWDLDQASACVRSLHGHSDSVCSVHWLGGARSGRPDQVVSGSSDSTLRIWSVDSGECAQVLKGHKGPVCCVNELSSAAAPTVISGGSDNTIRIWDLTAGVCSTVLTGHADTVWCLQVVPSRNLLLSCAWDHTIKLWDPRTRVCTRTFSGHAGAVRCLRSNGGVVVSGSNDNAIKLWDLGSAQCIQSLQSVGEVRCLEVLADNTIISNSGSRDLAIWQL